MQVSDKMPGFRFPRIIALLAGAILIAILTTTPLAAQDPEGELYSQDPSTIAVPEEDEETEETDLSEDATPIGIVDEIRFSGNLATSQGTVLRQMTFRVGDEISPRDVASCRRRIQGLNRIYWNADITWEPADEPGRIIVNIELSSRRTWFIFPSISGQNVMGASFNGGTIGDRNFLGTADTVMLSLFPGTKDYSYGLTWIDPQFMGGHQTASVNLWTVDTYNTIRTDTLFSTHESYHIDRNGFRLGYRTIWGNRGCGASYRWEDVTTAKRGDPFGSLGTDDTFFFSGTEIPDGHVGALAFDFGQYRINSRFFPTAGYYWSVYNEVSAPFTLSDFTFTRHTVNAAYFKDIYRGRNVVCGRFVYSCMTGDPPNYELNDIGWQVRGYTSGIHRGKAVLGINLEYRFIAEPGIFQGVLFADFGRAWDNGGFGFDDLEYGYGAGIRIHTSHFIPYNLLFRLDYGIGSNGEEILFGFNHRF